MKRRRELLATLGATTTALTAGCLTGGSGSKPVRVMRINGTNHNTSPADMNIELIRDGNPVFEETFELSAIHEDGSYKQISPEPGAEPSRYECLVEVNIRETVLESSFESDQVSYSRSNPCIEIDAIIDPSEYNREPGPSLTLSVGQINNRYDHPLCE
jgi:hypothetical protein